MKEWMMNDADIFDITENCFCKDPVCEKCDREIGNKAQRKLLIYLIAHPSMTNRYNEYVSKGILEQMLKELEKKRNV